METIRPATRRNATGPLRRLLWQREVPRPAPARRFWAYLGLLALLGLVGLGFAAAEYLENNRELPGIVIAIIAAGSVLPVAVCARWPVMAWRIAAPMMFLGVINAAPAEPWPWNPVQILGFLVVLGRLTFTQDPGVAAGATLVSLVPVFLYPKSANAGGAAVLLIAIATVGNIVYRLRRTRERVAEQEELTEAERAKRSVLEERARIAREMHDVVAHHMSMIAVRAETAPYRVTDLPASAQEELATIATAARAALTDMRRLLGALRAEDGEAPTMPQPGVADLDDLVTTARAAGVDVTLTAVDLAGVPGTVGLAAYRIMQEALANAARHAPGGPVTIDARGFADRLELTVRNKRTGPSAPGGGHGLIGMRERAALLGGELTARPDGSDFVVQATLPFGKASA
ncbi:MAG TPA: histidine kinase [Actinoplanes sp.]|nr:histidine kinase [Actinoplanes sp.]